MIIKYKSIDNFIISLQKYYENSQNNQQQQQVTTKTKDLYKPFSLEISSTDLPILLESYSPIQTSNYSNNAITNDIIIPYINSLYYFHIKKDFQSAHKESLKSSQKISTSLVTKQTLKSFLKSLYQISIKLPSSYLEDSTRLFISYFNYSLTKKKENIYWILVLLFKCFIKLNTLNMAKNIISALNNTSISEKYSKSEECAAFAFIAFYWFRLEEYEKSFSYFLRAFRMCLKGSKFSRWILVYLIPLGLLNGYIPTKEVSEEGLIDYSELIECFKGDLLRYDSFLQKHETFLLKSGVYLLLEKLKLYIYRKIIKTIYLCLNTTRLSLSSIQIGFKIKGIDLDDIELECLFVGLIGRGLVKGYLSHEHGVCVLSKQDPFPKITSGSLFN